VTTVTEATTNKKPPLGSELAAGVEFLSATQTITFTLYKRMILPLDGFLFWVNSNIVTPAPILPITVTIEGSLHYSTETEQEESSNVSVNTIVFTALKKCDVFQQLAPPWLYLANYHGIQFGFNSQGKYYQQADLWHYLGVAVKATKNTQVIDDVTHLNALNNLIITNSLPIWLGMPYYTPPYPGFICPIASIFPSFLVPANEPPPYASVHIEDTRALEAIAFIDKNSDSSQLTSETVRVTTYGVDNDDIITFLNFVIQYSGDWGYIGIMNMPIINDLKEIQSELQIIAQKKEIVFKISYVQKLQNSRNRIRELIGKCIVGFTPSKYGNINILHIKEPSDAVSFTANVASTIIHKAA
jgi:hypothetical protein